jgi:adenylate cyclase
MASTGAAGDLPAEADAAASAALPHSLGRRFFYSLTVLALLTALCLPLMFDTTASGSPRAATGIIDFGRWGALDRPVELNGQWAIRLDEGAGAGRTGFAVVPGNWTDSLPDWTDQARVTYSLEVTGLRDGSYVLYAPSLYGASEVRVDGHVMSRRGRIASPPSASTYHVRSHDIPLMVSGGRTRIDIELATGQHRDHGMESAPVIGLRDAMRDWTALKWAREILYNVALLLVSGLTLANFLFRPQDRAPLYFGLACFFFIPSAAVLGFDNILLIAMPGMDLATMIAFQYASGALAIAFFVAYAAALFPREAWRLPTLAVFAVFAVLLAIQLVQAAIGRTYEASLLQQWVVLSTVLALFYIIAIVTRAALRKRSGAGIFLTGLVIFALTIVVGALVTNALVRQDTLTGYSLTTIGVLMLLFPHVVIMADRWSRALEASEQSNTELRRLLEINTSISTEIDLEPLLRKIVKVTTQIVHADRSSLFLHDAKTSELWSLVAEGTDRELRFPDSEGIAGHCFESGHPIVIDQAYDDPRFLDDVDEVTGYRTRTLLAVPIVARNGRRFGVMEALNRKHGERFTRDDVARMMAFASQAAIAIENATLFAEVISERNYNDSILASMRNGVFTVDAAGIVAKSNTAARTILGRDVAQLEGRPAAEVLQAADPELRREIETLLAAHKPRTFLDIELLDPAAGRVSANLTIVPLEREEDDSTLVVIEDISEGKRLKGTLRRFIPAQIVDEVLDRKDDLLFGNACQASVLFSDIRNFTTLAEKMSPRATVDMLNGVFEELYEAVTDTGGVVDKFIGDALMAVYGVPMASEGDAAHAVEGARRMVELVEAINRRAKVPSGEPLRLGIGISTGEVIAGTIGSPKRMDYTVIGDSVNLASRLQGTTKYYRVAMIVSEATAQAITDRSGLRELDLITVRGRERPETIHQVLEARETDDGAFRTMLARYAEGRRLYLAREFARAVIEFEAALAAVPSDHPARLMRDRARLLASKPPAADWDGVWTTA